MFNISKFFIPALESITFSYCTECVVEKNDDEEKNENVGKIFKETQKNDDGEVETTKYYQLLAKYTFIDINYESGILNEGNNKIDLLGKIAPINVDHYIPETYPTPPTVINMFAQNGYGYDGKRYTSYDAFWSCLGHIRESIPKGSKIAFPYKIGCDRGGANWEVIYTMIVAALGYDYNIEICYLQEDGWLKFHLDLGWEDK